MKLKELPPHVRKIALQRAKEDKDWEGYSESQLLEVDIYAAFVWGLTPENHNTWSEIYYNQNYTPFNNFHKIKTNE